MARILMPLPEHGFDPTEAAVPWRLLTDAGHEVVVATERGGPAPAADPIALEGFVLGRFGADAEPRRFYADLESDPSFRSPAAWPAVDTAELDGIVLPGGHAPGVRGYLESPSLQQKLAELWKRGAPVGAICHGVLIPARARDPDTGRSLLAERRTTAFPKYLERIGFLGTFWKLGRYTRTYPQYVEEEVRSVLDDPGRQFERGPFVLLARGTANDDGSAFAVV